MSGKLVVKFTGFEQREKYTEYLIVVKEGNSDFWQLRARYRRLRQIYKDLKDQFGKSNLPNFPPKKYYGNRNPIFISHRREGLESFFNNVLKQFSLDELGSLKDFLYEGKKKHVVSRNSDQLQPSSKIHSNPNPKPPTQPQQQPTGYNFERKPTDQKSINGNRNKEIEKVIQHTKKQFLDLRDRFDPHENIDGQRRKEFEKIKLNFGFFAEAYRLPRGTESNLVSLQDPSLISRNPHLSKFGVTYLTRITQELKSLKLAEIGDIVVVNN